MTDDKFTKAVELKRKISDIQGFIDFTNLPLATVWVNRRSDEPHMQVDTELVEIMVKYYREKLNKLQKEFDKL